MPHCKNCGEKITEDQKENFNHLCPACIRLEQQKSMISQQPLKVSIEQEKVFADKVGNTCALFALIFLSIVCGFFFYRFYTFYNIIILILLFYYKHYRVKNKLDISKIDIILTIYLIITGIMWIMDLVYFYSLIINNGF